MSENQNQSNNKIEVSVCYDFVTEHSSNSIELYVAIIRSNQYAVICDGIHQLTMQDNKDAANHLKARIPAITPSCKYLNKRCEKNICYYSQVICLDLDNISSSDQVRIRSFLPSQPDVLAFFSSPSKTGLKIFVLTDGQLQHHRHTFKIVKNIFESLLKVSIDSSGSDPVRLCYLSHDKEAYYNAGAVPFHVEPPAPQKARTYVAVNRIAPAVTEVVDSIFLKCLRFASRKITFTEGSRNIYIFCLACYCRINGLSYEVALEKIIERYSHDFDASEIKRTVKSAYRYN